MSEQPSDTPDELRVSRNKEPIFRKYVYDTLDRVESIIEVNLIHSGSEVVEISPVTAKRYLAKMYSSEGKCERYRGQHGQLTIRYKRQDSTESTSTISSTSS